MTLPVNDGSDPPGHNGHKLGTITTLNKGPTAAFFARIVVAGIIILDRCSWDTANPFQAIEDIRRNLIPGGEIPHLVKTARAGCHVVLGAARFWTDQHAQGRWLANPRHIAHRSAK